MLINRKDLISCWPSPPQIFWLMCVHPVKIPIRQPPKFSSIKDVENGISMCNCVWQVLLHINWNIRHGSSQKAPVGYNTVSSLTAVLTWAGKNLGFKNRFLKVSSFKNVFKIHKQRFGHVNATNRNSYLMKKRWEARKHCTLDVVRQSQKFSPRRRPLPEGAGRPKPNQLEMVTTFTYKPSVVRIDARNFELSW